MFGIDLVIAFAMGLVWWEILLFIALIGGLGYSLNLESSIGFFIVFFVLGSISWGSGTALLATISFGELIWGALVFIAIGVIWSFFKWRQLVISVVESYGRSNSQATKENIKDKIARKKDYDTISFWILLWPFSVLGYVINDFIVDLIRGIIDRLYTVYDRITDKILATAGIK